ncbi:unnamed protein product [Trichogramma brassicae]|uniref:Uncharacterized protein n=1 Tax=Trichogramma brassicae TaxID=86971 RepID=A0A6H5IC67_9HYME|nr:unnamed protein product [Trichogramma brassicae]
MESMSDWSTSRALRRACVRLFVETASKQDLEKLISNAGLKAKGVSVTLKKRRLPRMIIYDVPVVQSDYELSQLLRKQNLILTPQHVLKPIFKVGKRDIEVTHWVMKVSLECRDVLVKEGGLYLVWCRCRVKEHCALTRCYKCAQFVKVLLDACLQRGVFPDEWKIARIVVLYKRNGKASKARSYRPISLLNVMSKVLDTDGRQAQNHHEWPVVRETVWLSQGKEYRGSSDGSYRYSAMES